MFENLGKAAALPALPLITPLSNHLMILRAFTLFFQSNTLCTSYESRKINWCCRSIHEKTPRCKFWISVFISFLPFDIYYQFDLNDILIYILDWINMGIRPSRVHGKCELRKQIWSACTWREIRKVPVHRAWWKPIWHR